MKGGLGRGLMIGLLVLVGTAAGTAVGVALGVAMTMVLYPAGAGLEGLGPPLVGAFTGSVAGAFVELAAIFKVRLSRDTRLTAGWWIVVLGLAGLAALVTALAVESPALWVPVAGAGLPLAVLLAVAIGSAWWRERTAAGQHNE